MQFTTYTVLALAAAVSAKQIPVKVGEGGLNFAPNDFTADVGDEVVFSYFPKVRYPLLLLLLGIS